ncbi:MarC family protein [Thermodesulfobacteriota bacterium]
MSFSIAELFLLLFATIGPVKPMVILAAATRDSSPEFVKQVAFRAVVTAAAVLALFIVVGEGLLDAFKVSVPAFQIGGGIILFVFALSTVIEDPGKAKADGKKIEPSLDMSAYPLAIPLMSSPATLVVIISMVAQSEGFASLVPLITLIIFFMILNYFALRYCQVIASKMNPGVTMVVAKVLAVCLVGLSVELVFVGLNGWGVVEIAGLKAG